MRLSDKKATPITANTSFTGWISDHFGKPEIIILVLLLIMWQ